MSVDYRTALEKTSLNKLNPFFLDIPTVFLPMTQTEFEHLHLNIGKQDSTDPVLVALSDKISRVITANYPDGAFIKMVERSPKDSFIGNMLGGFKCMSGKHAINLLCDSERIFEDTYRYSESASCLAIRKWVDMSSKLEFRLFIEGTTLKGASQYYYEDFIPEIVNKNRFFWGEINKKFKTIVSELPLEDVIIDLFYDGEKMIVIECNPFGDSTDPCLFNWDAPISGFKIIESPLQKESLGSHLLEFILETPIE